MTYKEAKDAGYKMVFSSWHRGYISRKSNVDDLPVGEAGGARKGMLYVDLPSWGSTRYCRRAYLRRG